MSRLFGGPHFLVPTVLCSQGLGVRLHSLVDTGAQGFLFLNSTIAPSLSQALRTPIRKLPFKVHVKGFQDQITSPVTEYIRLHIVIDGRKVRNCPFIVVDLGSQDCIIGIKWLKRFKLKLDTEHSRLLWPEKYPRSYDPAPPLLMTLHQKAPQDHIMMDVQRRDQLWEKEDYRQRHSPQTRIQRFRSCLRLPKPRMHLPPQQIRIPSQSTPTVCTTISAISANAFHFSLQKPQNEFFTTSLYEINRVLEEVQTADDPENVQLLTERLPAKYAAYADVFSKREAESLPEHRPYDHKIVLEEPLPNSYSPLYKSNLEELEAIKKFVQDQLRHG